MEAIGFVLLAGIAGGVWGICRVLDKIQKDLSTIRSAIEAKQL